MAAWVLIVCRCVLSAFERRGGIIAVGEGIGGGFLHDTLSEMLPGGQGDAASLARKKKGRMVR